ARAAPLVASSGMRVHPPSTVRRTSLGISVDQLYLYPTYGFHTTQSLAAQGGARSSRAHPVRWSRTTHSPRPDPLPGFTCSWALRTLTAFGSKETRLLRPRRRPISGSVGFGW